MKLNSPVDTMTLNIGLKTLMTRPILQAPQLRAGNTAGPWPGIQHTGQFQ